MKDVTFKSIVPNLMVENVNKTIDFYQKLLGFSIAMTVPKEGHEDVLQWAMLQQGNAVLMIQEKGSLTTEYPILTKEQSGSGLTLFIEVSGIDEIYNNIKNDVTIIKDIHVTFYKMKEFAILDLNNVVLTFSERI